jgi:antitoxin CptB
MTAAAQSQATDAAAAGRILWRCRRGMKELDVLLERYARSGLPTAAAADQATFEALLELPDPLLAGYFLAGQAPADPLLARLVARIRTYVA